MKKQSMHAGLYDCMRSDSESALGNQTSCQVYSKNYQTKCILVCPCMYVCTWSESESASHSSPPQLKGLRVISACARAFGLELFPESLYCVCLSAGAHRDTNTHTSNTKYTGTYMPSNDRKSTFALQHTICLSAGSHRDTHTRTHTHKQH